MPRLTTLATTLFLSSLVSTSFGGIILDFRDPSPAGPSAGTAGETLETGTPFTVGGLTVTATPSGTMLAGDGLLANADAFGVDSVNFGTLTDVPENIQFDGGETLALSFDQSIEITEIDLQNLVGSEVARVSAGSFTIDLFTGVVGFNGTTDVFTPSTPILVPQGTPILFEAIATGAAFGLQGLTVTVVPEPVSLGIWMLLAVAAGAFCVHRGYRAK